jgi:hypothetical protein
MNSSSPSRTVMSAAMFFLFHIFLNMDDHSPRRLRVASSVASPRFVRLLSASRFDRHRFSGSVVQIAFHFHPEINSIWTSLQRRALLFCQQGSIGIRT